ncbi:MAG: cysteine desulfurase family protein [Patescibacteria group bacterium]
MKRIYLDYASLTPIDKKVLREMKKYSTGDYTNPSALYASAVKAKKTLEDSKTRVAKVLHAHADEIIFTSGGTESNQLVLNQFKGKKIVISSIEHSSILRNVEVTHIPVDSRGLADLDLLKKSITAETSLVSVMMVNNEIGSIQPIQDIAKIVRDARKAFGTEIILHTDACQAAIHLSLYVEKLGIDVLTLDGAKIYGPRGVGALYIRRGTIACTRAGTHNIPGIIGFALALELAEKNREKETARISKLKNFFFEELKKINSGIKINGSIENSVPSIMNISIPSIDGEFFVLQLDAKGIECSTKSACLRDEDESYVLKAIGASSKTSVRFSFGRKTTKKQLKKTLKIIKKIV